MSHYTVRTKMRFFRVVTAVLSCWLTMLTGGVQCASPETASNVMVAVMADDINWYYILRQRIKISHEPLSPRVADMLEELKVKDNEAFTALDVVRNLALNRSATGSQLMFGLRTLATAVSCQFINTLMVHLYYAMLYVRRDTVNVPAIRWCLTQVQMALASYVDKLAAFDGQSLDYFVRLNNNINALHAKHDADQEVSKDEYENGLNDINAGAKEKLSEQCDATEEIEIVKMLRVNSYNADVFNETQAVEDHQLLAMIVKPDPYNYVSVSSQGAAEWQKRLSIVDYNQPVNHEIIIESENNEDDD